MPSFLAIAYDYSRASCHLSGVSWEDILNWPGQFPGIAENAGNHWNDGKFHESHKILNQIKETLINYVWEKSHAKKQQE